MVTVYKEVEIDVSLDDFEDDDLVDELDRRGIAGDIDNTDATEVINRIYEKRRLNKDYQQELDELIYITIGKVL